VVFDYIFSSVLSHTGELYGEKEVMKGVSRARGGFTFRIGTGKIADFPVRFDMGLQDHSSASDLETRHFNDENGRMIRRVNGIHNLVTGKING
jgi:hypothetical protein